MDPIKSLWIYLKIKLERLILKISFEIQGGISNESPLPRYDDDIRDATVISVLQDSNFRSPLPPPPTPPEIRNNFTISPQISVVSEVGDIPGSALNKEEPKYARVDIKNKRNSKQLATTGNCLTANAPMEELSDR